MSKPNLWITMRARGALVRGYEAERACRMTSPEPPKWSDIGRGWVVPTEAVPDLLAYAQASRLLVVVTDESGRKAAS